jgi:hypothetical protein
MTAPAVIVAAATLPPAIPLTHQSHPFWSGFSWTNLLRALEIAATVAPVVVTIASPANAAEAGQLSNLAGTVAAELASQSAPR